MREAILLAGLAALAAASPAAAQSGLGSDRSSDFYFAPDLNLVRLGLIHTGGVTARQAIGGGVGYNLGNGFRAEIAALTSRPAVDRAYTPALGSISSTTLLLRGLFALNEGEPFSPYIGGGLQVIDTNQRLLGFQSNDWIAAYQLRGGVKLSLSQKLFGSVEYSWTEGEKPHFSVSGISTKVEFPSHGFLVGMNYKFF
jgi:opacity protein-like surface antigen